MTRRTLLTPIRRLLLVASLLALLLLPAAQAQSSAVMTIELDGFIDPNAARYVDRAITEATDADAALLVIQLNTPGGLSASAREIVSSILESPSPSPSSSPPAAPRPPPPACSCWPPPASPP